MRCTVVSLPVSKALEQSTETTQSDLMKDWKVEDFIGFAVPHHRIRTGKLEFTVKVMARQDTGDMRY